MTTNSVGIRRRFAIGCKRLKVTTVKLMVLRRLIANYASGLRQAISLSAFLRKDREDSNE